MIESTFPQFIGAYSINSMSVCDELIQYFYNFKSKVPGLVVKTDGTLGIDESTKVSLEVTISPRANEEIIVRYFKQLQTCLERYIKEYPYCNNYAAFTVVEDVALVMWPKIEGGFKKFHTERCSGTLPNAARHLVFMTYLNDIYEGGETEFIHQGIKVRPRKGLTLIWPADWTFTHRGLVAPKEDKYIISGWFSYIT